MIKFKKILIGLGIIGAVYFINFLPQKDIGSNPLQIEVEGQTISFPYTDDNTGENMIIRTDKESYSDIFGKSVDVYVMVENKSGKSQISDLQFYFPKQEITVNKIWQMTSGNYVEIVDDFTSITSSSTGKEIKVKSGEHKENKVGNIWKEQPITNFSQEHNSLLLGTGKEKEKPGQIADKKIQTTISKDGIAYYKVNISLQKDIGSNEFFVEVVGDEGGYGLLDPTLYTDPYTFNDLSDGSIHGQDGWVASGSGGTDKFIVQTSVVYEGAKAVSDSYAETNLTKSGSAQASGTIFAYMRSTVTNSAWAMFIRSVTTAKCALRLSETGYIQYYRVGTAFVNITTYNANTWYPLGLMWEDGGDTCSYSLDGGDTWTSFGTPTGGFTTIDNIYVSQQYVGTAGTQYIDYISGSKYVEPPAVVVEPDHPIIIIQ